MAKRVIDMVGFLNGVKVSSSLPGTNHAEAKLLFYSGFFLIHLSL